MSAAPSPPPKSAADDRNLVAVDAQSAVTFADQLQLFWEKNGNAVLVLCGLIILGVIAKGGWEYLARQKQLEIETTYAAATTPAQLKAFAASHADHVLGGVAQLRMADDAYTAGKFTDAIAGYDKALGVIKTGPLAARTRLGHAMANIQAGKRAEGLLELKQLANDANQLKAIRTESSYQIASLAADAGDIAEVQKISEQLMQMDPSSAWAQRAMMLRATMPVAAAVIAAPAAPTATTSAPAKKDEAAPSMQIKLPGK
ncbi:MAG: tetratricopeptide repeat protein [Opitutus sp.]|nr:tetratricopeptide repeat protein [Opitutus sp.]